jgi:hypothetical protein
MTKYRVGTTLISKDKKLHIPGLCRENDAVLVL